MVGQPLSWTLLARYKPRQQALALEGCFCFLTCGLTRISNRDWRIEVVISEMCHSPVARNANVSATERTAEPVREPTRRCAARNTPIIAQCARLTWTNICRRHNNHPGMVVQPVAILPDFGKKVNSISGHWECFNILFFNYS